MVKQGASLKDVATSIGAPDIGSLYQQLFLGNRAGSIGESSIALILVGGVFLLVLGVIQWIVPVCMLASVALVSLLFGMDPLFNLLSGGVVFGAFFMATDYSTSPVTFTGQLIYGVGCGLLTIFIRYFGSYSEGVCYSILIMNCSAGRAPPFSAKRPSPSPRRSWARSWRSPPSTGR